MWIFFFSLHVLFQLNSADCLFDDFEKLSLLLGFSRDILERGEMLLHACISSFKTMLGD